MDIDIDFVMNYVRRRPEATVADVRIAFRRACEKQQPDGAYEYVCLTPELDIRRMGCISSRRLTELLARE